MIGLEKDMRGVVWGVYWEMNLSSNANDRSLEYPGYRALKTRIGEWRNYIRKHWREGSYLR